MSDHVRFRCSASDGTLELEGSEEFVGVQLDKLASLIRDILTSRTKHPENSQATGNILQNGQLKAEPVALTPASTTPTEETQQGLAQYPRTYEVINGELKIVASIQGANTKAKAQNVALLYCFGALLQGNETVATEIIATNCKYHSCYDSGNFYKLFKANSYFVASKQNGKTTIKLTHDGRVKAKQIIEGLETNVS